MRPAHKRSAEKLPDWKPVIEQLYPPPQPTDWDEIMRKRRERKQAQEIKPEVKRPTVCPCCNGHGTIQRNFERLNTRTGNIEKFEPELCLTCMGKGTLK